jgi:hypothetical protein
MKRLIFILITLIPIVCFGQGGDNIQIVKSLNIANVTISHSDSIKYLNNCKALEIQVDWSGLTGTLNSYIKIMQRNAVTMKWLCVDTASNDQSFKIVLSTTSGSHLFSFPWWTGSDFEILFVKNSTTGGYINASYGIRR